jgi:hypothetical protein
VSPSSTKYEIETLCMLTNLSNRLERLEKQREEEYELSTNIQTDIRNKVNICFSDPFMNDGDAETAVNFQFAKLGVHVATLLLTNNEYLQNREKVHDFIKDCTTNQRVIVT